MAVIGYARINTDKQDLEKQKQLLLEYAQTNQLMIDEFIDAEVSSTQGVKERRVEELLSKLRPGDSLLVAELSRLGRNMLQTANIINELNEKGISLIFIRQPELSTNAPHSKLLMAIYSYFAEAERSTFLSEPSKSWLLLGQRAKKQGVQRVVEIKSASWTLVETKFWIICRWVSTWRQAERLSTISWRDRSLTTLTSIFFSMMSNFSVHG
jgi:DNA invertase Pin-like site-specific DNA recombinase